MRKIIILASVLLLMGIFSGCSKNTNDNADLSGDKPDQKSVEQGSSVLPGDEPPIMGIEVNGEKHETELGSYCWEQESENEAVCVDVIVPGEDAQTIKVETGEEITLVMEYTPLPGEIHLSQVNDDGVENENIEINEGQFTAPVEKGVYTYNYSVWWIDKNDKDVSNGSADYGFILDVK